MLNQNEPAFGGSSNLPLIPTTVTNQCQTNRGFKSPATGNTVSQPPATMTSTVTFGSSNTNTCKENCESVPKDDESEANSEVSSSNEALRDGRQVDILSCSTPP